MTTSDSWEDLCEAYLAADELVAELMTLIAAVTAAGSQTHPTADDWALLRRARDLRDQAEAAMVAHMRQRTGSSLL